ncbi:hypothetical protein SAMD00019534_116860 [Acytostelium subglobosum LB1]|uniref:hypothetical protein n=1 Tax=Acytostelium subglobosum LB1 TaxID=1410327 RepID=UPI000644B350|nr:hypothetical protein SAMD00019534_116860 [Acytostelium subglobosum LB1]GAM28510.1 hypothetical protein SAMD00019534_116860 [Acytostelium subglobosum LB1]|eukprot:XP_012748549.1 hypothetical protein SAMD00019534_116860 [Acytostelium subglobosum LB1]
MSNNSNNVNKLPDRLHVLLENGEQLLSRLYVSRGLLGGAKTRPLFLSDEKVGRAIKNLMSKFPDFPELDRVQGADLITSRAKQYMEDLEQHYETLVDACDWKEATCALLHEIANNTLALKFTASIQLSSRFMELVVLFAKLHMLLAHLADRRTVLAVYARLFQHTRSQVEPNYSRLSRWIIESDLPVKRIQDDLKGLNDAIGHTLLSVEATYSKRRLITQLRRDGALNLILKPEDIARPIQDQYRTDLTFASRVYQWVIFGYLIAPGALTTPNTIELLKAALSEGFNLPVYREISYAIHNEFSALFKNYKSKTVQLQKQKKIIKDAAQASTQDAPRRHYEKRIYLRQELDAMWNLFRDKPCLLAPKINVLLAALSMAKEEVLWYFRHLDAVPPEKVKKYYNKQNDIIDRRIPSLVSVMTHLVDLVRIHKSTIQNYYVEYMAGADSLGLTRVLTPMMMQSAGPQISNLLSNITYELQNISVGSGAEYNFNSLRDNWCRTEYLLFSSSCLLPESESTQISSRLNLIYIHSKNVDQLDAMLEEYSSLVSLWPYKEQVAQVFEQVINDATDQPAQAMVFLKLLAQFPSGVATPFYPEEKEAIGKECVDMATNFLNKLSSRIVSVLYSTMNAQYQSNEQQLRDVNAAFPLLQKRKDWKPPKDFITPVEPGSESQYRSRATIEQLRLHEKNIFQLCNSLNEFLDITIYDRIIVPREFLRDRLGAMLKQYMRQTLAPTVPTDLSTTIRPATFESQLQVFLGVMVIVENFVDIDIGDLIRETLLGEFYAKVMGKVGRIDWFPDGEIEYGDSAIHYYTNYYVDFVKKSTQLGHVYSPGRQGFLSRPGMQNKAEDHNDYTEIMALTNTIGAYGVKLIERELLRTVLASASSIKDILTANLPLLEEYATCFHKPKGVDHIKRFKQADIDNFVTRAMIIGNALSLRSMMRRSVDQNNREAVPYIQKTVETGYEEYNRNTFMFPEFLGVDALALDAGLNVGVADQYLKVFLKKICAGTDNDRKLWDMLPVMFAVAFNSTQWKEAIFRPSIEGYNNNIHVLAVTISDLLIAFGAINNASANEADIVNSLHRFLEISSVHLLRMFSSHQKHLPNDPASVLVFLDKFTEYCPLLNKDMLEQYLPYTLIRNMYKDIYELRVVKQGDNSDSF